MALENPISARSEPEEALDRILAELASFRYLLRKFLRFSESAARDAGVTPQQHQLMLGIGGFNGTGKATVSELAEFLQEKHHSVVGLIDRAVNSGLVRREGDPSDGRIVVVSLTSRGRNLLKKLSLRHHQELNLLRKELFQFADAGKTDFSSTVSATYTSVKQPRTSKTNL